MTNAIEQTKRAMYGKLAAWKICATTDETFESALEAHLEALRQELVYQTKRAGDAIEQRDAIQLRLHAVDHAYNEQQSRAGTLAQDSGDRGACAPTEASNAAIQGAAADIRKISDAWAMTGRRAKKSMRYIAGVFARPEVYAALESVEKPTNCMHSFFAVGDDQMKCTFCGVGK